MITMNSTARQALEIARRFHADAEISKSEITIRQSRDSWNSPIEIEVQVVEIDWASGHEGYITRSHNVYEDCRCMPGGWQQGIKVQAPAPANDMISRLERAVAGCK
jgi:hypothetical protein